jgi:hypothetical protein
MIAAPGICSLADSEVRQPAVTAADFIARANVYDTLRIGYAARK